jgi:hypothetical protein
MKVYKINAKDVFDDDNNNLIYGLESDDLSYIEWFKTKKEREEVIIKNKMRVLN